MSDKTYPFGEPLDMTDADIDTEIEVARNKQVDDFLASLNWSSETTDEMRMLVAGNVRAYEFHKKTTLNSFMTKLGATVNSQAQDIDNLKSLLRELLPELESLPQDAMDCHGDRHALDIWQRDIWIERIREAVGDGRR